MNKAMKMVLTLTAMLAAGCSDGSLAPKGGASEAMNVKGGGSTAELSGTDTLRFSFVIDPTSNSSFSLGQGNHISFPKGSVCDIQTSTYGPTEWDAPCQPQTAPVTVTAKAWLTAKGHPAIDFQPAMRFVPSANPSQWVTLNFTDYNASWAPGSVVLYCGGTGGCVNENKDITMATGKDPIVGRVGRRIKHFSGYSITTGEACYTDDWDCVSYR